MKYDIILFDLDGTLTDSALGITNAVKYALNKLDIEVRDSRELLCFIGPPLMDSFMKYYGFDWTKAEEAVRLYREYYKDRGIFESSVYAGIPECLDNLKNAGKKLVLATSKPQGFSERILEHFNLSKYFDLIVGATMDEKRTKKSEVIEYALEELKRSGIYSEGFKERILMIGDRENDIQGARVNGIDSMGVLFGFGSITELSEAGADYIVNTPDEISSFVCCNLSDIHHYDVIDSTNTEARRLLQTENITEPVLLIADEQTAGRGRQGKSFYSPSSTGLYMTLVLPVNESISSQVTMTTRTASAVSMVLERKFGIEPEIKWVNDIYLKGRKCCGILCEAVNDYEQMLLKYAIIGVGINISTSEWPEELKRLAGSILQEDTVKGLGNSKYGYMNLAVSLAEEIQNIIADKSSQEFLDYYRRHSNVIGHDIIFYEDGIEYKGFAKDVDESGALIVEILQHDGSTMQKILNSGEISVRI